MELRLLRSTKIHQWLALKRLIDVSMGVLTPLSEQLTKPLPNAMVLINLKELSSGTYKLLLEGTRLAISVCGDEPYEELDIFRNMLGAKGEAALAPSTKKHPCSSSLPFWLCLDYHSIWVTLR
uniref:Uncharacterized protein n=1 Tax=Nelumbo nucifera TaxID=4432 RepID=A0A822XKH2_NELNU|nr:TPA_asm: hypothetical protein HUJ06_023537 [Nelumbo nucifera]